ncbi:MAG: sensor histidine kinase [Gaiellaceae bacterium]
MTRWRPWRDVRGRLLGIVLLALVAALATTTYGFNVLFTRTSTRDANTLLRARANSELGLIDTSSGLPRVVETTDDAIGDSQIWIFAGGRRIEGPRRHSASDRAARSLAGGRMRFFDVPSTDERLYATPIESLGRPVGTLVTGLSLAPYEQTQRTALIGSLALAGVLLSVVGVVVYLLLRSALRPVERMTVQAEAWSEHELDRRFALGEPHDELTRLGSTLDELLDRLAASLRHERRFSAELSHELRTPLAKVIAEAELALRREREPAEYRAALEVALRNARQVARIVEALVAAAQQEAGVRGTADAQAVAAEAIAACGELADERGIAVELAAPQGMRVGIDGDLAERIIHPVVENACRYARSSVRVSLSRRAARVVVLVEDDGPGVAAEERERIFEPGSRGEAGRAAGAGAGLGLALARRLARSASGEVEARDGDGGTFAVELPSV